MFEGVSIFRSEKVKDELISDGNDKEFVSMSCEFINQVYVYVISSKPFSNLLLFRL